VKALLTPIAIVFAACAIPIAQAANRHLDSVPARSLSECGKPIPLDSLGPVDVAIVIDSSRSTADPSGADINMNGEIGKPELGEIGLIFDVGSTDPGDSFLWAQVAAARSLIGHLGDADARFSVVSFSGVDPGRRRRSQRSGPPPRKVDAVIESGLTDKLQDLEAALDRVLASDSAGGSKFSAGMRLANQTLRNATAPTRSPRRLALFISDSPLPSLPQRNGEILRVDPAMKESAQTAIDSAIVFHTFGLGEAATTKPPHALSMIAGATGGAYHPVEDAARLHCELLRSLVP
jgi:hypothetical protein